MFSHTHKPKENVQICQPSCWERVTNQVQLATRWWISQTSEWMHEWQVGNTRHDSLSTGETKQRKNWDEPNWMFVCLPACLDMDKSTSFKQWSTANLAPKVPSCIRIDGQLPSSLILFKRQASLPTMFGVLGWLKTFGHFPGQHVVMARCQSRQCQRPWHL